MAFKAFQEAFSAKFPVVRSAQWSTPRPLEAAFNI